MNFTYLIIILIEYDCAHLTLIYIKRSMFVDIELFRNEETLGCFSWPEEFWGDHTGIGSGRMCPLLTPLIAMTITGVTTRVL